MSTHEALKNLKEGSCFEIICKKARTFATDLGIVSESSSMHTSTESTPVVRSKRVREVSKKLKEFVVSSSLSERFSMPSYDDEASFYDAYKDQVLQPAINKLIKMSDVWLIINIATPSVT